MAEQELVWAVVMDVGEQETLTEVMVAAVDVTDTLAEPDLLVSCVEVAVMVAVPEVLGVKTPEELIAPFVADQVTEELYRPLPLTVAEQALVCVVLIDDGEHAIVTE